MFVGVVCTVIPLFAIVRLRPVAAIRGGNEIDFRGLPGFIEAFIARGSAPMRYALRNIFRRKRLSAATILLVCAAVSLPTSLLTTQSSWLNWAEVTTAKIRWDGMVTFKGNKLSASVLKSSGSYGLAGAGRSILVFASGLSDLELSADIWHRLRVSLDN